MRDFISKHECKEGEEVLPWQPLNLVVLIKDQIQQYLCIQNTY